MAPFCRECEYDLRELDRKGSCPECGTPIEWAYARDLLQYEGAHRLRRMVRECSIMRLLHLVLALTSFVVWIWVVMEPPGANEAIRAFLITSLGAYVLRAVVIGRLLHVTRQRLFLGVAIGAQSLVALGIVAGVFFDPPFGMLVTGVLVCMLVEHAIIFIGISRIGERLPTADSEFQATTFLWLGPPIFFFGLCIGPPAYYLFANRVLRSVIRDVQRVLDVQTYAQELEELEGRVAEGDA